MKEEKWLLRKVSGSRGSRKIKTGDYADGKPSDLNLYDELPIREAVQTSHTRLDTTLVGRWLSDKVGMDFDAVYSEFISRIQPKYLAEYRDCIFWYTEPRANVSFDENGDVYGIFMGKPVKLPYSRQSKFYVDPETNILKRIPTPKKPTPESPKQRYN